MRLLQNSLSIAWLNSFYNYRQKLSYNKDISHVNVPPSIYFVCLTKPDANKYHTSDILLPCVMFHTHTHTHVNISPFIFVVFYDSLMKRFPNNLCSHCHTRPKKPDSGLTWDLSWLLNVEAFGHTDASPLAIMLTIYMIETVV